jgi:uncharacterized membrane protein YfcA
MFDYKFIFSTLILAVLLIATSSIGIQSLDQQKKTGGPSKIFLFVSLGVGLLGVLLSLGGGIKN